MIRKRRWLTLLSGITCLTALCSTSPVHADPYAANQINGMISVHDGISLTNGKADIHQGLGDPDILEAVPQHIADKRGFRIDGWGPVVDAKWQIQDNGDLTEYWVDAHLTTSVIDFASASCQIFRGVPGQRGSYATLSDYSCVWSNYRSGGKIAPELKVERIRVQDVNDPATQDSILKQYCTDQTRCRYVSESFDDKVIDTEKLVGTPVSNTTSFMATPQYSWSHTVSWSDTAGGKVTGTVKVAAPIVKIVEATLSVELNYAHTWGNSRSFSETIPLPIGPHSMGYITHQAVLAKTNGYFIVDTGLGGYKKLTNRSFTAPREAPDMNDPSYGNWIHGQLTLYNCPLDQWNHGANSCRHPAPSSQIQSW